MPTAQPSLREERSISFAVRQSGVVALLVGHPEYYSRLGFENVDGLGLEGVRRRPFSHCLSMVMLPGAPSLPHSTSHDLLNVCHGKPESHREAYASAGRHSRLQRGRDDC